MAKRLQGAHSPRMKPHITALERAFELARTGKYSSVTDLKRDVIGEGYDRAQLEGFALGRQLKLLIRDAAAS